VQIEGGPYASGIASVEVASIRGRVLVTRDGRRLLGARAPLRAEVGIEEPDPQDAAMRRRG